MKAINFIIFFSIVLAIYGAANYYIFIRGWQALPLGSRLRIPYLVLFIFLAVSYVIGRFLEKIYLSLLSDILVWIGSFWIAMFFYFFLIVVLIDLARLINHWLPFFHLITDNSVKLKQTALIISTAIVVLIVLAGFINACAFRVKELALTIPKRTNMTSLHIVAVSDIHLGTIVGRKRFCKIVNKINSLNPDLILLVGDVVDEDLAPVIRENLGEALLHLRSKLGVYAITGNHEYFGGVEAAVQYLKAHGVTVLRDSVVNVNSSLYLVGREDRSSNRIIGRQRKELAELIAQTNKQLPVILLDHQPFKLNEAAENGFDLQLSGHTHHGQLWPLNYITKKVYEKSWGYLKKGNTHIYVSCGVGTWGPPARLGNRPEILDIKLEFASSSKNQ
ncbi:MAG: metallophosphoesterase [candidate division KSB1 bacterium]|nr:metallophosphoesterase [candidate division KSB1 bacterium]MDZ7357310.1 metallophosphoesterase [candidate division KSB1 bacterium]MDZ7376579.1 metallophosphoesterase [candidate division KSB1 bacterium]MDZ7400876.1 metallophosphoesterase [candidate division KSB1 bacterium]